MTFVDRKAPQKQMFHMINWLFDNGVTSVDIHLRCPRKQGIDYNDPDWYWLTQHHNLSKEQAFKILSWCRFKNREGADIYIRPHRHLPQPLIFLDDLNINEARKISAKYTSLVIETSENNTQVWIHTDCSLSENGRLNAQRYISELGYGDKGSISGEHLGRLCGVKSQKRKCWVNLLIASKVKQYSAILAESKLFYPRRGACVDLESTSNSESEREFGLVLGALRKGILRCDLERWLTEKAQNRAKRSPSEYAKRTLAKACSLIVQT